MWPVWVSTSNVNTKVRLVSDVVFVLYEQSTLILTRSFGEHSTMHMKWSIKGLPLISRIWNHVLYKISKSLFSTSIVSDVYTNIYVCVICTMVQAMWWYILCYTYGHSCSVLFGDVFATATMKWYTV